MGASGQNAVCGVAPPPVSPALPDVLMKDDTAYRAIRLAPGDAVVVCTHALPAGGAERQWVYLASGLQQLGYRPTVVLFEDIEAQPDERNAHYLPLLKAEGIPMMFISRQPQDTLQTMLATDQGFAALTRENLLPDANRLARLVLTFRQLAPKAVFAQLDPPNLYAGFAALLAGVPRVVLSFRSYNPSHFPQNHQPWFHAAYAALGRSDRVLFSGNAAAANRDYEAWIGLKPRRAITIANAVSEKHFPRPPEREIAACRTSFQVSPGGKIVIGVFRLVPAKGPFAFLEVCAGLAKAIHGLRVLIVGIGFALPELEARVAALGLNGIVMFLGRRNDVNLLMAAADLLLLASEKEGMPNVVLEAQLQGVPVVATETGAVRGAILPGITGLLCPVGDVPALTEACTTLLQDTALRRRMGEAGARHARGSFGIERMCQAYLQLARTHAKSGGLTARRLLLGNDDAAPDEEAAFFAGIRNGNGVFKTTRARRMDDVNALFAALYCGPARPRIMDVGASSGISTVEWQEDLVARGLSPRMVATDIMIDGFLIRAGDDYYILTDKDGRALQHDVGGRVVGAEEAARLRPGAGLADIRADTLWRRIARRRHPRRIPVKLITPRARRIRFLEDDIFAPNRAAFRGRFDVLRAANLLNLVYFPQDRLRDGVINLRPRLKGEGAMFIVNRTLEDGSNHGSVFRLDSRGRFEVMGRVGDGSEIEGIVLGA